MIVGEPDGRWPPVYDADDLAKTIKALVNADDFGVRFWSLLRHDDPAVCQGDIVHLDGAVPVLDENGEGVTTDECSHWLVIGNTCDFARAIGDEPWSQLVPTVSLEFNPSYSDVGTFEQYKYSRRFYIPPWPNGDDTHRFADFTRPVTIHKEAFSSVARVVARMDYPAWVLLHSCLVRFLARDDGRHDG